MSLFFEWDDSKARTNFEKHAVSFEEATTVFGDPGEITIHDPAHSIEEDRFISIGHSYRGRLLVVVYTDRRDIIRIISARLATRKEKENHEETK